MADYFPLLSRTIASLGNSTPEQRQIVYERARSVVADQLSAIEPPMDSEAIKRELSLFEASVMRLEHEMQSLEAIKPVPLPGETETRKHISARLSALLAKAAAARAATTQDLLKRDIETADPVEGDAAPLSAQSPQAHITPRVTVDTVPEPVSRVVARSSAPMVPQVVERKQAMPSVADAPIFETPLNDTLLDGPEPSSDPISDADQSISIGLDDTATALPHLDLGSPVLEGDAGQDLQVGADPDLEDKTDDTVSISGPDVSDLPRTATQTQRGSLSQLLLKAQDFWHKKPPSQEPATHGVGPDETADPQDSEKADLLIDDTVQPLVLVAEEPPQLALSGGAVEDGFVGPVLPVSEPQDAYSAGASVPVSADIVFSDDAARVPDDRQSELSLVLPANPLKSNSSQSKPTPASEIDLLDDGRPRLAQRRKRDRGLFRGLVMGLAFVSVIAAVAGAAWVLRDRPADFEQSATATRGDLSRKITDRLPSEAASSFSQTGDQAIAGGAGVAASGQRVMLFEEGVEGQPEPVPVKGRVSWALETIRDQTGAGDVAIKADIRDLSDSLSAVTMVIKRNRDIGFPASHLIELNFATSDNSPNGRVRDIGTPEMRAEEGVRGTSLSGLPVPVTENVFLVGLTNLPDRIEQNSELLRNRNWIVIPMRFANGRRAVMMVEKGLVGDRVLLAAFQAWK
jgi:hypothetical protein